MIGRRIDCFDGEKTKEMAKKNDSKQSIAPRRPSRSTERRTNVACESDELRSSLGLRDHRVMRSVDRALERWVSSRFRAQTSAEGGALAIGQLVLAELRVLLICPSLMWAVKITTSFVASKASEPLENAPRRRTSSR